MRLSRGFVLALFFVLSSSSSQSARAEGSAEFDAADTGGTHDPNDQALTQDTELFVDISDATNERICWRGNGSLNVSRPNGGVAVGTISNNQCVDAVNGVNGAYAIDMQTDQNMGTEWDIRVCPKTVNANTCFTGTTNERIGRLWSYDWNFQENTSYADDYSINGSVFAIVPGGDTGRDAVIEMQMRGVSGARYHLFANGIGPEESTSPFTRVGRSAPTAGHRVTPSFPLYLNLPAKALYNWIQPQISNVVLAANCGGGIVQDRATPGSISFNSNVTGQYVVICDVDNNSVYDFAAQTDFSSFGAASPGTNTVTWNGKNNAGTNATEGNYNCLVRLNVGEFHYMAEDIETAYPGIRMFRIESDKSTRTGIRMFWDDTDIAVDMENMGNAQRSPNSPIAAGLDPGTYASTPTPFYYTGGNTSMPQGNARAWGNYDGDGKGNEAFLDQFAAADTAISPPFVVKVIAAGSDSDTDGLTNTRECDLGSNLTNNDSDGDGVGDGVEATNSTAPNTDNDGPADILDPDSDNDGVNDGTDGNRLNPNVCRDTDSDQCDDCILTGSNNSGGSPSGDGTDTDSDGKCNPGDPDDDNDGVNDADDSAPDDAKRCRDQDSDGCDDCAITGANSSGGDPNNDGPDPDGDGRCDTMGMPASDSDGDGVDDDQDLDRDNDGIPNSAEGTGDLDGDGTPNALDLDSDGDGLRDVLEGGGGELDKNNDGRIDSLTDSSPRDGLHDPLQQAGAALPLPDSDGDGAPDFLDADADSDDDGVPDPEDLDRDDDGIPNSAEGTGDLDGDGVPNALDLDSDGDGLTDVQEAGGGDLDKNGDGRIDELRDSDPQDGLHDPLQQDGGALPLPDGDGDGKPEFLDAGTDADGDGVVDDNDLDRDNDGIPNTQEGDEDLDGDGIANVIDLDSDGDGLSDVFEAGGGELDANGDGRIDTLADTSPRDGWHDPLQSDGAALPVPDTDEDGEPDFLDADDDGDGLTTRDERPDDESVDSDGDGDADYLDADDDGDGLTTRDERPDDESVDTDDDGTPDYLDTDDDDDGIPTADELDGDGKPRDSDRDGKPDHLDADDDGDGVETRDERTDDGENLDTDGDDKPDHLDTDDDGDGIPTEDEPSDADDNGKPDRLEPSKGTLAGGALCSVRQAGAATQGEGLVGLQLVLLSIAAAGALRSRRRRKPRAGMRRRWLLLAAAGGLLASQQHAHAQVALDQFRPAPLATDGFGISRPTVLPHLTVGALLELDYANDPLVYEHTPGDPDSEEHVVEHDLVLHAIFALGLWDRVALFLGVPVHLMMEGDENLTIPAPPADGAGLGDILFGGRVRIAGDDESLAAFAAELLARFPTAEAADRDQSYRGDEIGSYEPALILELHAGIFDVRARAGLRLRETVTISNLELGHEFSYGLGARLRVAKPLVLHAEAYGSTYLSDAFAREHSPAEALLGAKLDLSGWVIGAAAGPGLMRGYGSPDVRVVGMLGYAEPRENAPVPVDTDLDGLFDPADKCPAEPEDFDHFQDTDGCPDPDNDRDGVLDVTDRCRNEPEDLDSFEDADGCPDPDNDRDGILDVNDRCPLEPEDTDDFEDQDGCPDPDNDKDRYLDANDTCPDEPEDFDGFEDDNGCPEEGEGLVKLTCEKIEIKDSVYFDSGKDRIQERSFTLLNQVAAVLQQATQIKRLRVEGHTDDRGKDAYNLELSQRRAASVLRYLVERGIADDRLASEGYGETKPIADNKSAAGRSQNRRVEFVVIESDGCP